MSETEAISFGFYNADCWKHTCRCAIGVVRVVHVWMQEAMNSNPVHALRAYDTRYR